MVKIRLSATLSSREKNSFRSTVFTTWHKTDRKNSCLGYGSLVLTRQPLAFNPMNIGIPVLFTRNLPIHSGVSQLSHPLIIPLHCLWAKSNNRTCGQSECDVTWLCFCFYFVRSHARCDCCSICWRRCGEGLGEGGGVA